MVGTNYETWNFKLWLDNEQETQNMVNSLIIDCKRDVHQLSKKLEQYAYDGLPLLKGFYSDLLNASLREINFHEVAEAYIEDLKQVKKKDYPLNHPTPGRGHLGPGFFFA